jgi:hypothetical protein
MYEIDTSWETTTTAPPDYIIKKAQERAMAFRQKSGTSTIPVALKNLPFSNRSLPEPKWVKTHLPDINIIGLPKAGTSQLYQILVTHPQIRAFHAHGEFCFNLNKVPQTGNDSTLETKLHLANSHEGWEGLNDNTEQGAMTVNKCMNVIWYLMQRNYLIKPPANRKQKIILLLRDPADWLWAAWNFWIQPYDALPGHAQDRSWASAPSQYRSPELFHEYMLAGDRMEYSKNLVNNFRGTYTANGILEDMVDNMDLLVLKNEDLVPENIDSSGLLDNLANFLGLSKTGFDVTTLHSLTNCNDHKGLTNVDCKKKTAGYTIAGNRSMLEKTRELVYLHFAEECQMLKDQFHVDYSDCLAVQQKYINPHVN